MPYSPSTGVYTLPAIYLAVPGAVILALQHNQPLEDLEVANNYARPIVAGGTGANNATAALANLGVGVGSVGTVSIGTVADFAGSAAPSLWLLCFGQAISRTTYEALFAVISTTYGVGDGSTTFNVPDLRGRVSAGQDDMGGISANRLTVAGSGLDGDVLGGAGGLETHTITAAQMAAHTHTFSDSGTTSSAGSHSHAINGRLVLNSGGASGIGSGSFGLDTNPTTATDGAHTHTFSVAGTTSSAGSGSAHNNVQPTIILNKIIYAGV